MSFLWPTLEVRSSISTCANNVIEAVTVDDVCYVLYSTAFIDNINSYYIISILHLYHCKKDNSVLINDMIDEFVYF